MLIGSRVYSNLERTLGEQAVEGNLLLLGLRGSTARQQKRLALIQNKTLFRPDQGSILFAGTGEDGKIAGGHRQWPWSCPRQSIRGRLSDLFTALEPVSTRSPALTKCAISSGKPVRFSLRF